MAVRSQPSRRIRSRIDRDKVVAEAMRIADRDGLQNLSMRSLAEGLGVVPMALYRHVADKDDLLDALVEALLAEIELPTEMRSWRTAFRRFAGAVRQVGHRHPGVFPLLLSRPTTSAASHRPVECLLGILELAGLPPRERVRVNHVVTTYILGFVMSEISGRFAPGTLSAQERLLALPSEEFPAHRRVAAHLVSAVDWSREFDAGVEMMIRLIETSNRRRSG